MKDPCKKCSVRAACTIGCTPHDKFQEHVGELFRTKQRINSTWLDTVNYLETILAPLLFIFSIFDLIFHVVKYFLAKINIVDLKKKKKKGNL